MIYETYSAEETAALGEKLGREAKPGDVCTLMGDLGVGKTVLTQGIAKGLGITANLIEEILPPVRKEITIEKDLEKGFDYRKITIEEVGA